MPRVSLADASVIFSVAFIGGVGSVEEKGYSFLIVYADGFIVGFQYKEETEAYYREMQERMQRFGLEIESSKR